MEESSCSYSFTTQSRHWYISSSAQPSLSFHYAWYGGTGFLCVGHPGHLVPPLGLYFLCLGIIQSCLPASPVFPYLGLIFTQINLSPNTSLCTNCTFFGGKSFELGNIYIVWITSRGQIFSWSCWWCWTWLWWCYDALCVSARVGYTWYLSQPSQPGVSIFPIIVFFWNPIFGIWVFHAKKCEFFSKKSWIGLKRA